MNKKSFVIVFMTVFIDLLGFGLVVPTLPNYTKELGASNIQVGFIAAVFSLMNFLCTPFLGSWSDRVGRRPIILFGIAANFIGYLLFSRANTIPLLIISRFISGIGSSNISAAQAYIADISSPENRTKSLGMIGAAFGLGFVFDPALGGLIKAHFGMEYVGYAAAALCFVNLITAYFMLPESLKEMNLTAPIRFIPINDYLKAFNTPIIKQLFSMWFLYVMAFSMMQTIVALLWKEHYHQDDRHIATFLP